MIRETFKEAVARFIPAELMPRFRRSFDTIGDIAVVEIPDEFLQYEKQIGKALLAVTPTIKVVVKKVGGHVGTFRIQKYRILAGARRKTTITKENGVSLRLHLEATYYSPRMSTERARLLQLIQPKERILALFSGIGPYPIVFAKNKKDVSIVAVEMNPKAHALALENAKLNKVQDRIRFLCGDVRTVVPQLHETFDRITMPLPKTGEEFLDVVLHAAARGATIHFYDFLNEEEFHLAEKKAVAACQRAGRKYTKLGLYRCGQQGPRQFRVCLDFRVD